MTSIQRIPEELWILICLYFHALLKVKDFMGFSYLNRNLIYNKYISKAKENML